MASHIALNSGSTYCRDCGGSLKLRGDFVWCENTIKTGNAPEPKDLCEPLSRTRRKFCEHCGTPVQGPVACSEGHVPNNP
jgi:hypothetical protein